MADYAILIYGDEAQHDQSPAGWAAMMDAHGAFAKAVAEQGASITGGNALQSRATATSIRGGSVVTDGPFAETKETLGGFYLHRQGVVSLTVVFCAVVAPNTPAPTLGDEHDAYEWLPLAQAMERCAWPREREAMQHIAHLLRNGRDGGAVEDVLRVV